MSSTINNTSRLGNGFRGIFAAAAFAGALAAAGCERKALPESGSPGEQTYAQRCGGCHRPYNPASMTRAMWETQVKAMQLKMAQAGVKPLSETERSEILGYLERNAGKD